MKVLISSKTAENLGVQGGQQTDRERLWCGVDTQTLPGVVRKAVSEPGFSLRWRSGVGGRSTDRVPVSRWRRSAALEVSVRGANRFLEWSRKYGSRVGCRSFVD